jgi:signal transduction histidine kinase/CheY-like chemotaxis protein
LERQVEPIVRMLGCLAEPLLVVQRSGMILGGNAAAARALGTTMTTSLAGTTLSAHTAAPNDLDTQIAAAAEAEAPVAVQTRDGRELACHLSVLDNDMLLVRLAVGQDTNGALSDPPSYDPPATVEQLARRMLSVAVSSVGARMAGIYLLDDDGLTLELVGSHRYRAGGYDRFRLVSMTTPIPLTECVREATPLFLLTPHDFERREPGFLTRHPYVDRAMVFLPLVVDTRCIGAVLLGHEWPWQLADANRTFLGAFATQCAVTLDRARSDESRLRHLDLAAERFDRLHAFAGALARAITPADVAEVVIDAGAAATGARGARLWLLDDSGSNVSLVRSVGPSGPGHPARVPLDGVGRRPVLDAIESGAPVWIESSRQLELRYPDAYALFPPGGELSLACVPLLVQGRAIGAIAFDFGVDRRFLAHERAFFQMITWYAAQAVERARLYAVEQQARSAAEARQQRTAFLAESDALLATLDYQSILAAIASTAVPRIADWCIVEIDEERRHGRPAIALHVDPAKSSNVRAMTDEFHALRIPDVLRNGRSLLYKRDGAHPADPALAVLYARCGTVSSMIVPITARGVTLGTILLGSTESQRVYDPLDLAMAEELGRKVGLAIENARLYRDAREADRLKDEFLAMLSHELRNPLVPIVAAVDLIGLEDNDQFVEERGLIQRNTRHLVRLLDDLLDVARITRGKISLAKEHCEMSDLVRDAVEMALPLIEDRDHRLRVACSRRGLPVLADRGRIAQAIANLLTNAAKYTDPGGTITVTAQIEGANVVVRVEDTGIGIAEDDIPHIFDIFVQAPDSQLARRGGLGIGLTVVKRLIELHGGTVSARSNGPGCGSEFVIALPLTTAEAPAVLVRPRATAGAASDRRVLVVDDNHDAATAIAKLMDAVGFTTHVVHDGPAALDAAPNLDLDLALLDLGLPDMDGYELARQLRASYPSLRIVALTGFGMASDRRRSREAGFDDHIVKPLTLDGARQIAASIDTPLDANEAG